MKKIIFIYGSICLSLTNCSTKEQQDVSALMEDTERRNEIYDKVLENDKYLSEFTGRMAVDEKGKMACMQNPSLVKMAFQSPKLDSIMNHDRNFIEGMADRMVKKMAADTTACSIMCGKVMQNENLKNYVRTHVCEKQDSKK